MGSDEGESSLKPRNRSFPTKRASESEKIQVQIVNLRYIGFLMEKFSIICPCCEATLTIDAQPRDFAHEEKKKLVHLKI